MILNPSNAHLSAKYIQERFPQFKPKVGIVLGSGLHGFTQELTNSYILNYDELPGFPKLTVYGHIGQTVLGYLDKVPVICLQGRTHLYEGASFDTVKTYVRTLKLLGCEYFLATNASGSLCPEVGPGELMLITDHINLQFNNPLIGPNDHEFGPRFLPLDNTYNEELKTFLLQVSQEKKITLHQGVYIAVTGPNYETAAEIKAFRLMGADAVGMSTVPEVLVAHHCGMKVAVIATITNFATGLSLEAHNHATVVSTAAHAAHKLVILLKGLSGKLNQG